MSTWLANKEKLFTSFEKPSNKKREIRRNGNFTEVDLAVFKWFVSQSKNIQIDRILLREKAKIYAQELGVKDFKASDGWLGKWKKKEKNSNIF